MRDIPRTPLLLGLTGLIPFLWGLLTSVLPVAWMPDQFSGTILLAGYAVVILPFMSGVIWGFATRATGGQATTYYMLSVIPALWAFFFIRGENALLAAALGFVALLPIDNMAMGSGLAPGWWMRLRLLLTGVVVFCLVVGHVAA